MGYGENGSVVLNHALFGHRGMVSFLAWEPHGRALISTSLDGTVRLWDVEKGREVKVLKGHEGQVLGAAWAPEGQSFVTIGGDRRMILWNYPSCQMLGEMNDFDRSITSVSWSPSGKHVLTTTHDLRICVWDIHNRRIHNILDGHTHYPRFTAFSPRGEYMASATDGKWVRLWKGGAYSPGKVLKGHKATVNMAAWMSDDILGTVSDDQTVRIWDARKGKCLQVLTGHAHFVKAISFLSDGRLMATRSWDNTLRIWRCDNWETIAILEEDTFSPFPTLAFQPRGDFLASVGLADQVVRIFSLKTDQLSVESQTVDMASFRDRETALLAQQPAALELVSEPVLSPYCGAVQEPEDDEEFLFCGKCGEAITPDLIEKFRADGQEIFDCATCGSAIPLPGSSSSSDSP